MSLLLFCARNQTSILKLVVGREKLAWGKLSLAQRVIPALAFRLCVKKIFATLGATLISLLHTLQRAILMWIGLILLLPHGRWRPITMLAVIPITLQTSFASSLG